MIKNLIFSLCVFFRVASTAIAEKSRNGRKMASSSSSSLPHPDPDEQLRRFITQAITPTEEELCLQVSIMDSLFKMIAVVAGEKGYAIDIQRAGSREKGYDLKGYSDFDVLIVFKDRSLKKILAQPTPLSRNEIQLSKKKTDERIQASVYYNMMNEVVGEASRRLKEAGWEIHSHERPFPLNLLALGIQLGEHVIVCDITCAVPAPGIPSGNY